MSIPKEPRQLMINIMYLVLTALLALNVSAEIFNAFEMVDEGLISANKSLEDNNKQLPELIRTGAKKKASLQTYADRIDAVTSASDEATAYIDELVEKLIDASGNNNGGVDDDDYVFVGDNMKKELRGKKNYDGTTRLMVDQGLGDELKTKMMEYREKFIAIADSNDVAQLSAAIPINIDEESWKLSPNKKKGWADFTFGHMPLGATMPIFSKFKNDIKSSEAAALSYLANKVGTTTDVVLDKFKVVSAPKKTYVIKGEKFETDVFLSASAGSDSNTGITISVNGQSMRPDADGVAKFSQTATSVGIKKYNAAITVKNPTTEEVQTFRSEFEYEVGERSVAISASKMNVFYIGVDNPVEISAAGVASNQVQVSMTGGDGQITRNSDGTYKVVVKKPTTDAKVNVSAPGMTASKTFRVKKIPNPVPKLSAKRGGVMSPGEFKAQQGVRPDLENFDFDTKCNIVGYRLVRVAPRSDAEPNVNRGGKYNAASQALVAKAKPGDRYFFEDIKCKCPGDVGPRDLGNISFNIR
ncbi:MAG: GldM family protein [Saprospiraceae bacterium]|nr:GldM family protein [Saprospiraceae bacterium]